MKRNILFVFALVLSMFLITGVNSASAQQLLYAADGAGGNSASLMILDPDNAQVLEIIGPIGYSITGMAFSPDGTLYGVTGNNELPYPRMIQINTTTGAGTLVDPTGTGLDGNLLTDISFSPQGTLYGWATGYNLAWVNETTAMVSLLPDPGVGDPTNGGGLAFLPNGTLYLSADADDGPLYSMNPVTGAATLATNLQGGNHWGISGMSANNAGTLYGMRMHNLPIGGPPTQSDLITINPTNGQITSMGNVTIGGLSDVPNMSAIAFSPIVADVRTGTWVPGGEEGQTAISIEIQHDAREHTDVLAFGWGAYAGSPDGEATWLFARTTKLSGETFSGDLLRFAGGPCFTCSPSPLTSLLKVGTITITFTTHTAANITGSVDGVNFNKSINKTFQ
jgi:hypothetical protein